MADHTLWQRFTKRPWIIEGHKPPVYRIVLWRYPLRTVRMPRWAAPASVQQAGDRIHQPTRS